MLLSGLFRKGCASDPSLEDERLEQTLERLVAGAQKAWPSIVLAPEIFVPYLARRAPPELTLESLERMNASDLWLACACVQGNAAAIAAFTKGYLAPIFPLPGDLAPLSGDVEQLASFKLLVPEGDAPPRIADYAGRGDLGSWVSVVALRMALGIMRKAKREVPIGDDRFLYDVAEETDAELVHLKNRYRTDFAEAFQQALQTLRPRDRNILRQHHVDHLTMEQIARLYRVHRITVVRWMESARSELATETRKRLVARLGIGHDDLDSIMRLIRSQVDVSLRTYLRPNTGASQEPPPGDRTRRR